MTTQKAVLVGDILELDIYKELVSPNKNYEMVGVLSFGRGLFDFFRRRANQRWF